MECTVLIVDDIYAGEAIADSLHKFIGGEIIIVNKIENIPKCELTLILYEPMLFSLKDFSVIKKMREEHVDVPFLCYTTLQNIEDVIPDINSLFDGIILKPINKEKFIRLCCNFLKDCSKIKKIKLCS